MFQAAEEVLLGLKFQISPSAFFQGNIKVALYM